MASKPTTLPLVCTIGHSNRPIGDFLALLAANEVRCVVDIRTVPKSRHNPQFGQDQLPQSLAAAGIGYRYVQELGVPSMAAADGCEGIARAPSYLIDIITHCG